MSALRNIPRTVAVATASPDAIDGDGLDDASHLVAADVLDAYQAYEHISALRLNAAEGGARLLRLEVPARGKPVFEVCAQSSSKSGPPQSEAFDEGSRFDETITRGASPCPGAGGAPSCHPCPDALIVIGAAPANDGARPGSAATLTRLLDRLHAAGWAPGAMGVFGIAITPDRDCGAAIAELEALRSKCGDYGLVWSGGIAAGGGTLLERLMRCPRLGMWRRPLSEAVDKMIAAVRMGYTLPELDRGTMAFGALQVPKRAGDPTAREAPQVYDSPGAARSDVLAVPCRLPRLLYMKLVTPQAPR